MLKKKGLQHLGGVTNLKPKTQQEKHLVSESNDKLTKTSNTSFTLSQYHSQPRGSCGRALAQTRRRRRQVRHYARHQSAVALPASNFARRTVALCLSPSLTLKHNFGDVEARVSNLESVPHNSKAQVLLVVTLLFKFVVLKFSK